MNLWLLIGLGVFLYLLSQRQPVRAAPRISPPPQPVSIKWVQERLNTILGANLAIDGIMGPKTLNALKTFQGLKSLPVTGTLTAETLEALRATGPMVFVEE